MRLYTLIRKNEEALINGCIGSETSGATRAAREGLRDVLRVVAVELETPSPNAADRAGRSGIPALDGNAAQALSLAGVMAAFRVLRESVTWLWGESNDAMDPVELVRFNRALDRQLEQWLACFMEESARTRHALESTTWTRANRDRLTHAPNRQLFLDRLEQDIRLARRSGGLLAVLCIDLDRFRTVNERVGHDGGDTVLKEAVERIGICVRETDTVARVRADRFAAILVDAGDENHVAAVARAILTRLSRPFVVGGDNLRIAASVGIALFPDHGDSSASLIENAAQAMRAAKGAGGDALRFHALEQRPRHRPVLHHGARP